MSITLLVVLTVLEIVILVVVLAVFLLLLTARLKSVALTLSRVAWGVRAVEIEVKAIAPPVLRANALLEELTGQLLPGVAEKAERLAAR